jgi:hypothetical protein
MPVIKFSYGDSMSTPLDSDLLRTFLAVADTGNLTRAADTVRRTQRRKCDPRQPMDVYDPGCLQT